MEEIKNGDCVKLKTGGPKMIVTRIHVKFAGAETWSVGCSWFDKNHNQQTGVFSNLSLEKTPCTD